MCYRYGLTWNSIDKKLIETQQKSTNKKYFFNNIKIGLKHDNEHHINIKIRTLVCQYKDKIKYNKTK